MTIQFHSRICCYLLILIVSCKGKGGSYTISSPLSFVVTNPRIQRLDPERDDFYEWNADVIFYNNASDTIYLDRTKINENILFSIKHYIIVRNNVYVGKYNAFSEAVSGLYKMPPGDSVSSKFFFVLPKDYVIMDDLYLSITTEYSNTWPPHDSLVTHHPLTAMEKGVLYKPTTKYHVNNELNTLAGIDLDIDSLMLAKGYNAIPVDFW